MVCCGCGKILKDGNLCAGCEQQILKHGVPDYCECCKALAGGLEGGICKDCRSYLGRGKE